MSTLPDPELYIIVNGRHTKDKVVWQGTVDLTMLVMLWNGLQAYTIRKMDQYMSTGRNIEYYKLLSVHEQPLDNRQKYLDVLCFPILFPTGKYVEFHPRPVKLSFSKYIKSRLMNTDSRFRKEP